MSDHDDCIAKRRSEFLNADRGKNIFEYMIRSLNGEGQNLESLVENLSEGDLVVAIRFSISERDPINNLYKSPIPEIALSLRSSLYKFIEAIKIAIDDINNQYHTDWQIYQLFPELLLKEES